ncbi:MULTISPECIES: hypothetical protein [Streptomyces]|uniref:DNA-binding protein n=1 Tax=Streptomyces ramulosus TaxID=47762 RepID=A0ABW1FPQ2_9ACTN
MSAIVTNAVWSSTKSQKSDLLVILALAKVADDEGNASLPMEDIAGLTGLSTRAVKNCLDKLYDLNELAHTPGGGRGRPNRYQILLTHGSNEGSSFQETAPQTGNHVPGMEERSPAHAGANTPVGSISTSTKQASLPDSGGAVADSVDVPEGAQDLVTAMTTAGMLVGWRLNAEEWRRVTALSARWGTDRLVDVIARRWDPARPPKTARYLLRIWSDLPSAAPADIATSNVVPLRPDTAWRPSRTPMSAYENGF